MSLRFMRYAPTGRRGADPYLLHNCVLTGGDQYRGVGGIGVVGNSDTGMGIVG